MIDVRIQSGPFDAGRQLKRFGEYGAAGVASFTGILAAGEEVGAIEIEHYAALAKSELARIAEEAERRWAVLGIILIHRHGRFAPGDQVLFAAVAAADPDTAQEACRFLVDSLRTRPPFWRRELLANGGSRWFQHSHPGFDRPT